MGLIDRFSSNEEDPPRRERPYKPEEYGYEDFSDEVRVWIVDAWPAHKPINHYDLMFIEDPGLEDPVNLHCPQNLIIPEGTGIIGYDESSATKVEGVIFHVNRGLLVHPHVIEYSGIDDVFSIPEPMQGRELESVDGSDLQLVQILWKTWQTGMEID